MPPFDGPRATLWVTRYPSKTSTRPSSIVTGIETTTAFLHFESTLTRLSSMLKALATLRSCSCAISYGFSRRCETDSWIEATFIRSFVGDRAGVYDPCFVIRNGTDRAVGRPPAVGQANTRRR